MIYGVLDMSPDMIDPIKDLAKLATVKFTSVLCEPRVDGAEKLAGEAFRLCDNDGPHVVLRTAEGDRVLHGAEVDSENDRLSSVSRPARQAW